MKKFDLNIEKVLEDWGVSHALREVIANALDEQVLTNTRDFEIIKDKARRWHVRDYGRGLKYEHLTHNENQEKLSQPEHVIGKSGVGSKTHWRRLIVTSSGSANDIWLVGVGRRKTSKVIALSMLPRRRGRRSCCDHRVPFGRVHSRRSMRITIRPKPVWAEFWAETWRFIR